MPAKLAGIFINLITVTANENIPEIERGNRTIKERMQYNFHSLPYNKMPKIVVVELAHNSIYWLNAFPYADGISNTYGSASIVVGHAPTLPRTAHWN